MINTAETLENTRTLASVNPPGVDDIPVSNFAEGDKSNAAAERVLTEMLDRAHRDAQRFPSSSRAQVNLAVALVGLDRFEDAKQVLAAALQSDPKSYLARLTIGRCHLALGELVQARESFASIQERKPTDRVALLGLAEVAARSNQLDEAIEYVNRAIEANPESGSAHFQMALYQLRAGQSREAIANLKSAVRLVPHSPVFHQALGVAYAIAGQRDQSRREFGFALGLAPEMSEAIKGLSKLLIDDPSSVSVIELLTEHIGRFPRDVEARALLAAAYFNRHDYRNARRHLYRALYEMPETLVAPAALRANLANNLGVCYDRLGDAKKAEKLFRAALEWHAEAVPVAYTNLAVTLVRTRRAIETLDILDQALTRFPSDPRAKHLRGVALAQDGQTAEAIECLRELVAQGRAFPASYGLMAFLLGEEQKQPVEAIAVLTEGIRKHPKDVILKNSLAYEYLMSGAKEEARRVLHGLSGEGIAAVLLCATNGLLKLHDHDFDGGRAGYEEAARLARKDGEERFSQLVLQKMHLELARAYIRDRWYVMARQEIKAGLELGELDGTYYRDLLLLDQEIESPAGDSLN